MEADGPLQRVHLKENKLRMSNIVLREVGRFMKSQARLRQDGRMSLTKKE